MTFQVLTTSLEQLRRVTAGVPAGRLDDPTPCPEWTVAQVLLHAAGDQHAWASFVGSGQLPSYDPFAPPRHLDGTAEDLIGAAALPSQPGDDVAAALLRYLGRDPGWTP